MDNSGVGNWPALWNDLEVAAIDVETTGFDFDEDRIIEIGIVRFRGGEVIDTWGSLVNPQREIPGAVVTLTGIDQKKVADAPLFSAIADEVGRKLADAAICAYNLSFDQSFVTNALARCGLEWPAKAPTLDPLIFARQIHEDEGSKKLGDVAARLGIDLANAHRATDDARAAGQVLYAFAGQLPERLQDLLLLQAQWEAQQETARSAWRRGRADEGVSAVRNNMNMLGIQTTGLGPGYLYGQELDPLCALYSTVQEAKP